MPKTRKVLRSSTWPADNASVMHCSSPKAANHERVIGMTEALCGMVKVRHPGDEGGTRNADEEISAHMPSGDRINGLPEETKRGSNWRESATSKGVYIAVFAAICTFGRYSLARKSIGTTGLSSSANWSARIPDPCSGA